MLTSDFNLLSSNYYTNRQAFSERGAMPVEVIIHGQVAERIAAAQDASDSAKAASIQAFAKYLELSKEYEAKRDSVERMIVILEKENEKGSVIILKQL